MTVMFALADPSPTSTSYGALYLASQIYVYRWPLWVKVMFTSEEKKNTDGDNGGGDDANESGKRSDSHQPSFTIGRH